jgi:hypothetical protein
MGIYENKHLMSILTALESKFGDSTPILIYKLWSCCMRTGFMQRAELCVHSWCPVGHFLSVSLKKLLFPGRELDGCTWS